MKNNQILSNYLVTALDIEDSMSGKTYGFFLDRDVWPAELNNMAFKNIKNYLNILIEDTKKHQKIIDELKNKF